MFMNTSAVKIDQVNFSLQIFLVLVPLTHIIQFTKKFRKRLVTFTKEGWQKLAVSNESFVLFYTISQADEIKIIYFLFSH